MSSPAATRTPLTASPTLSTTAPSAPTATANDAPRPAAAAPQAPTVVTSQTGDGDGTPARTADHSPARGGILGVPSTLGTSRGTNTVADSFSDLTTQEQLQIIQAAHSQARFGATSPHFNDCQPRDFTIARQLPPNDGPLKYTHTYRICSAQHRTTHCPQLPGA